VFGFWTGNNKKALPVTFSDLQFPNELGVSGPIYRRQISNSLNIHENINENYGYILISFLLNDSIFIDFKFNMEENIKLLEISIDDFTHK